MTDRKALFDSVETPEDVATLYSWANLHGAKYRDFSASRAQTRERARVRVQEAIEEERLRAKEEAEAMKIAEALRAMDAAEAQRQAELASKEREAQLAAQETARQATQQRAQQLADETAQQRYRSQVSERSAPPMSSQSSYAATPSPYAPQAQASGAGSNSALQGYRQSPTRSSDAEAWSDSAPKPRSGWTPGDATERISRPAWLAEEPEGESVPAPEDTLQGSRDRLTSRWFALKSIFHDSGTVAEVAPASPASRAPVLAIFSLAGGVGKTSLVATLGRALSARGERVLLVDTASYGLLPFYFGARDQRPGVLRTFSPPNVSGDAPIQLVTLDPESLGPEGSAQEFLTQEILRMGRGASRVIVDLATASGATTRRVLRLAPTVLVPVVPDMNSVVSVSSIDGFFEHHGTAAGIKVMPQYILSQFDPALPLHLDVREVLREQLGERLLPLALHRTPAVSEALAEGMTVMDYAPNSTAAEDFGSLAGWVKSLAAPASGAFRGVRWSER
jgi:cellulose synthase operon protein YhjQ